MPIDKEDKLIFTVSTYIREDERLWKQIDKVIHEAENKCSNLELDPNQIYPEMMTDNNYLELSIYKRNTQ